MAGCFKVYDIRGIVGETLWPERVYLIGRGLAAEIFRGEGPVLVSRDMRPHSPEFSRELIRGLNDGGCDTLDLGLAPTPMNYWGNATFGAAGSVAVTASHNGSEYNGFKVSIRGAAPIDYATGLDRVERYVEAAEAGGALAPARESRAATNEAALTPYLDWMRGFLRPAERPLKIAIDTGNGMGGHFLPEFCEKYAWLTVVPLFWELDGTFPNHEADPLRPENLEWVQAKVREENCDFGVAFDGDADRCMFVDEQGTAISSDLITALIARRFLVDAPGSAILYDLRSSRIVPEWIAAHGGRPVRGKVGHTNMKRLLKGQGAVFGGELSGHYYFADSFHTDSGLRAMIEVMNIWQEAGEPLSTLIQPLRRYSATGEVNFHVADVKAELARLEGELAARGAEIDHLDGLTATFGDWWVNLRPGNTEPLLRLNLEAPTEAARDEHFAEVSALIGKGSGA